MGRADSLKTAAAILAGGKSRRMGRDKAFVEINGGRMIEKVIDAITPIVPKTVIIANAPDEYRRFSLPVYDDLIKGMGPLSGLHTAFHQTGAEIILLVACDMPYINPDVIRYLIQHEDWNEDALIPVVGGKEQGLLALYRRSAIEKVSDDISRREIQFDRFRQVIIKRRIEESELARVDPTLNTFININSPGDLELS